MLGVLIRTVIRPNLFPSSVFRFLSGTGIGRNNLSGLFLRHFSSSSIMAAKRKFIIDCDIGIDDAQAVFMALAQEDIELIAITTIFGNTTVDDTTRNSLRVLQVAGILGKVPIYAGCGKSLTGVERKPNGFHGFDGLGDTFDKNDVNMELIEKEHAAQALIHLVNKHRGEITLVAVGPLTNLALAIRMDPMFGSKLKACYIMGGASDGVGNSSISPKAEVNFFCDPEAAHVVLTELNICSTIIDLPICKAHFQPMDLYQQLCSKGTAISDFIKKADAHTLELVGSRGIHQYPLWDQLAMAVAIDTNVAKGTRKAHVTVDCGENRGQMILHEGKEPNCEILTEVDEDLFRKCWLSCA